MHEYLMLKMAGDAAVEVHLEDFSAVFFDEKQKKYHSVVVASLVNDTGTFNENPDPAIYEGLAMLLSRSELQKIQTASSAKRKIQFALGRIAAKAAVLIINEKKQESATDFFENARAISIDNRNDGAPFIKNCEYGVSVSHSKNYAAAVVSDKFNNSLGVDIEHINVEKIGAIRRFVLESEDISYDPTHLTLAWTFKEALSKAMLCGLNVPPEYLKIKKIAFHNHNREIFSCQYDYHKEYFAFAKALQVNGGGFLAIAGKNRPSAKVE